VTAPSAERAAQRRDRVPRAGSLPARLTVLTAVAALTGLVVAAAASVVLLWSFLLERTDDQLTGLGDRIALVREDGFQREVTEGLLRRIMPAHGFLYLVQDDGTVALALSASGADAPAMPQDILGDRSGRPIGYTADGVPLRLLVVPVNGLEVTIDGLTGGPVPIATAVLAVDLSLDHDTVRRLVVIEGLAVIVVAAGLAAATATILRRGLRPLTGMVATARSIASGDVSGRLPPAQGSAEATDLAEAINDALDQRDAAENRLRSFVADASHELRTPLTTVHGWADLYLQGGLEASQVDSAMERIEREATRMRRIVDDLGLLARLDADLPLHIVVVDLAAVAREAVRDAAIASPDRSIGLEVEAGGDPAPVLVRCDEERVAQILRNLVGNAVQHTPSTATVQVRLASVADTVRIEVSDDGPGITARDLPHVFERFYRGRSRPSGEGSGLGLAIVTSIARSHGGSVDLSSEVGRGTRVVVALPVAGPPRAE